MCYVPRRAKAALGLVTDTRVYLRPRNEEVFVYDAS